MDIKDYKSLIKNEQNKRISKKSKTQEEKDIENSVLEYLIMVKNYFAIKINRGGVFDPTLKIFRKDKNPLHKLSEGCADIQFFITKYEYITQLIINSTFSMQEMLDKPQRVTKIKTITVFLEVKTKTGKQSEAQKEFQRNVENAGCIYRVVRSIDDVEKLLSEIN